VTLGWTNTFIAFSLTSDTTPRAKTRVVVTMCLAVDLDEPWQGL